MCLGLSDTPRKPKFKVGNKVTVSRNGVKTKPKLAGRAGVVTATSKEDWKLSEFEVRVKLNGNTRSSVYDEGYFTKLRGKK